MGLKKTALKTLSKTLSLTVAAVIAAAPALFGMNINNASATYNFNTESSYMYGKLKTAAEKNFYNKLLLECNKIDDDYNNNYSSTPEIFAKGLSASSTEEVALMFYHDHPEFFWLMPEWKLRKHAVISSGAVAYEYYIWFDVYDEYQNASNRYATKTKIINSVNSYTNGAKKYSTKYEKVKYVYDRICANVTYVKGDQDQSVVSALLEGKSVCAGYAKSFELICKAMNIDCFVEVGFSHAWNAVKIDNNWYLCDITNDDAGSYSPHNLFLISENTMNRFDKSLKRTYTVTYTYTNGTQKKINYLMHEPDYVSFPVYSKEYPKCSKDYDKPVELGDVNGDDRIDAADATLVLIDYATKLSTGKSSLDVNIADVNNDGVIDAADSTAILIKYAENLAE